MSLFLFPPSLLCLQCCSFLLIATGPSLHAPSALGMPSGIASLMLVRATGYHRACQHRSFLMGIAGLCLLADAALCSLDGSSHIFGFVGTTSPLSALLGIRMGLLDAGHLPVGMMGHGFSYGSSLSVGTRGSAVLLSFLLSAIASHTACRP